MNDMKYMHLDLLRSFALTHSMFCLILYKVLACPCGTLVIRQCLLPFARFWSPVRPQSKTRHNRISIQFRFIIAIFCGINSVKKVFNVDRKQRIETYSDI
jgi:hypothetical protein